MNAPSEAPGVLAGFRVVEGSAFIAAPIAGLTLAQLGADVIRFDPIGGGLDHRRWPLTKSGRSLYWAGLNKGKRSISIDVRSPQGREIVLDLITSPSCGAYLTNLQYRWLEYSELRLRRPDLLMVQLVGDTEGHPAFDYTVNAAVGYPMATGPVRIPEPVNHVLPAWDLLAGMHAVTGLLAAERRRNATGEGQLIRLALSDVALAMVGNLGHIAEAQINGTERARYGNYVYGSFGAAFRVADGRWIMVVAMTPRHWEALCQITGTEAALQALSEEEFVDLADESARFEHREAIWNVLRPWFAARSLHEIADDLDGAGIPWGPYQTFLQLVNEDLRCSTRNPMFSEIDHPGIGRYLTPGSPIDLGEQWDRGASMAPSLGENTDEVLADVLGLTDKEIGRLHDEGIVAGAEQSRTASR